MTPLQTMPTTARSARRTPGLGWPALLLVTCIASCATPEPAPTTGGALASDSASDAANARRPTGEILRAPPPDAWQMTTQLNQGDLRILEYSPPAGSPLAGDEVLRLESFRQQPLPEVTQVLNDVSADYHRRCSRANVQLIRADHENGFPVEVRLFTCPGTDPAQPPLQMLKAIRGDEWFYVVSRSSRAARTTPEFLDELGPRISAWALYLRAVTLCVPDTTAHTCPPAP